MGRNEGLGRMHGTDKMDTEANAEEGKIGNLVGDIGEGALVICICFSDIFIHKFLLLLQ